MLFAWQNEYASDRRLLYLGFSLGIVRLFNYTLIIATGEGLSVLEDVNLTFISILLVLKLESFVRKNGVDRSLAYAVICLM